MMPVSIAAPRTPRHQHSNSAQAEAYPAECREKIALDCKSGKGIARGKETRPAELQACHAS
jgi:hypothetical protein